MNHAETAHAALDDLVRIAHEQHKTIVALSSDLQEARAELERLRDPMCNTCGGMPPISGLKCVCGGTGKHWDEERGLRLECHRLDGVVDGLERDLTEAREQLAQALGEIRRLNTPAGLPVEYTGPAGGSALMHDVAAILAAPSADVQAGEPPPYWCSGCQRDMRQGPCTCPDEPAPSADVQVGEPSANWLTPQADAIRAELRDVPAHKRVPAFAPAWAAKREALNEMRDFYEAAAQPRAEERVSERDIESAFNVFVFGRDDDTGSRLHAEFVLRGRIDRAAELERRARELWKAINAYRAVVGDRPLRMNAGPDLRGGVYSLADALAELLTEPTGAKGGGK